MPARVRERWELDRVVDSASEQPYPEHAQERLDRMRAQVAEARALLLTAAQAVLERGPRVEALATQAEELGAEAQEFQRRAQALRSQYWYHNFWAQLGMGATALGVVGIATGAVVMASRDDAKTVHVVVGGEGAGKGDDSGGDGSGGEGAAEAGGDARTVAAMAAVGEPGPPVGVEAAVAEVPGGAAVVAEPAEASDLVGTADAGDGFAGSWEAGTWEAGVEQGAELEGIGEGLAGLELPELPEFELPEWDVGGLDGVSACVSAVLNGELVSACNARCLRRATACTPASARRRAQQQAPDRSAASPAPASCVGTGWASLPRDVLLQLAARLGLRERLAAARTCRHWASEMAEGCRHVEVRVDDASCPSARGEEAAGRRALIEEGRRALPSADSLTLTCYHVAFSQTLMDAVQAVSRWGRLRHLRVTWDETPFDRWSYYKESYAEQKASGLEYPIVLDPSREYWGRRCMGAVGLLTGLRSLSLDVAWAGTMGLFGLSALTGLTSLELRSRGRGRGEEEEDSAEAAGSLAALPSLRRLVADTCLLDAPLLRGAAAALTGLTHLGLLTDLDAPAVQLFDCVAGMTRLRSLTVQLHPAAPSARLTPDLAAARTTHLAAAIARLTAAQLQTPTPESTAPLAAAADARRQRCRRRTGRRQRARYLADCGDRAAAAQGSAPAAPKAAPPRECVAVSLELRPSGASGTDGGDQPSGRVLTAPELTCGLVDALASISGLVRLELGCKGGTASNMHRLSELTALTHLSLAFSTDCNPGLGPGEVGRIGASCVRLHTLHLALPADAMGCVAPVFSGSGSGSGSSAGSGPSYMGGARDASWSGAVSCGSFPQLRVLYLESCSFVRELPYARRELRLRLTAALRGRMDAAAAAAVSIADLAAGSSEPQGPSPPSSPLPAEAASQVTRAVTALAALQALSAALPDADGVRESLRAEAAWQQGAAERRRRRQQQEEGEQEGKEQEGEQEQKEEEEGEAQEEEGEKLGFQLPSLPRWLVLTASEGGGWATAAGPAPATAGEDAAAGDADSAEPDLDELVPLHRLTAWQITQMRSLVMHEEVLTAGGFVLGGRLPVGLEELRLSGFGHVGAAECTAPPPGLGVLRAVLTACGGPDQSVAAAVEAEPRVRAWVAAGGGAGQSGVRVEVVGDCAKAVAA
ncbi:hypothetical protein HYH03_018794 [Edaphochlamys debaryana]|uniref:V-SNARE coiled-coil homology domain-containing protein n=1 Tax=Edaphochlamys debaryana TaxID=47281 RepID=A0A835XEM0_9CHLO|nr:hypothetical protein HYH03_018794 [Edaphochlamys debaryana]|eukprot:KAG2482281.1 hypothetical protein HYH03_018794 [Edaphochlamys debaryana]